MKRTPTIPCTSTLFALALLAACTPAASDDGGETGESGETGDPVDESACVDPGTDLLPNVKPVLLPSAENPVVYTCTSGWGTDAPKLAPEWTVQAGDEVNNFDAGYTIPAVAPHPDGGVVVVGIGHFGHYDSDGQEVWLNAVGSVAQYDVEVEPAGTILLSSYDWMAQTTSVTRYGGDGTMMAEIDIAWNSPNPSIWGIDLFGTDLVIGANDQDTQGNYETALIRLDVDGNQLLRKSTSTTNGSLLIVNDGGTAVFGGFPSFLVALENGEVLGMLQPSMGALSNAAGAGADDFAMTGSAQGTTTAGDLSIGRYNNIGSEQWLQTYDRASLQDQGRVIATGPDGTFVVAGGTSMLNFTDSYWYNTQPVIFGVDADGNATWTDRIAAHADPLGVTFGVDGDVYVIGYGDAGIDTDPQNQPPLVLWVRRYVPS